MKEESWKIRWNKP